MWGFKTQNYRYIKFEVVSADRSYVSRAGLNYFKPLPYKLECHSNFELLGAVDSVEKSEAKTSKQCSEMCRSVLINFSTNILLSKKQIKWLMLKINSEWKMGASAFFDMNNHKKRINLLEDFNDSEEFFPFLC